MVGAAGERGWRCSRLREIRSSGLHAERSTQWCSPSSRAPHRTDSAALEAASCLGYLYHHVGGGRRATLQAEGDAVTGGARRPSSAAIAPRVVMPMDVVDLWHGRWWWDGGHGGLNWLPGLCERDWWWGWPQVREARAEGWQWQGRRSCGAPGSRGFGRVRALPDGRP
jgi:hypothetical protein